MTTLKWMLSSDFQIPYQDDKAVELWWKVMRWFKPDVVDYLGDISDQFCFSRHEEGSTKEFLNALPKETSHSDTLDFLQATEKRTADLYKKTRKIRPNAEIFSALGNHDVRCFNYLDKKMPDFMEEVDPEFLWGLDTLDIDYIYYQEKPKLRYGGIHVHHGISALAESGASVKSDMDKLGVSYMRGHSHRMGTYFKTYELRNETIVGYEIGHMCKVDSEGFLYTQIHNWQQGFAVGLIDTETNQVHIELVHIKPDYSCWVAGKLFKL